MNVSLASNRQIRASARPCCDVCGSTGRVVYSGLTDRLFGAPGSWSLSRCGNPQCGTLWMDPMPLAEDLGLAYAGYYTHNPAETGKRDGWARRVYSRIKADYLARRYRYPSPAMVCPSLNLGLLLYLLPVRRSDIDAEIRLLPSVRNGSLLDVGCGAGDWVSKMQDLGWKVRGVDFDAAAVQVARQRGLEVDCGAVEDQRYPAAAFDAVTLNHVIEHVPDPLATVAECRRLLKPGGRLLMFTPNAASLAHGIFGRDWRGLEPPRHLHLFSPDAMRRLLQKAGFADVNIRTMNSEYVWELSCDLWSRGPRASSRAKAGRGARFAARLLTLLEQALLPVASGIGECLAAQAVNRPS